ncbi:hypothetical protein QJS66_02675 [Kocuria rhizophila]|nr:hypothetical protein QJS66_02675 [Kocuria rhizophila]
MNMQYVRNDVDFHRGTSGGGGHRGDHPTYEENALRIQLRGRDPGHLHPHPLTGGHQRGAGDVRVRLP